MMKMFHMILLWGSIEVQQFFLIIMNNLTSRIAHLLPPIIGVYAGSESRRVEIDCPLSPLSQSSKTKQNALINPVN